MKKTVYALYALWVVACITLKIIGVIPLWFALSPLWFTFAVVLAGMFLFFAFTGSLEWWAKRKDAKNPPSCANCIHGKVAKYAENGKCLGEAMDENVTRGTICKLYNKHN